MNTDKQGILQSKVLVVVDVGLSINVYSDSENVEVKLLQAPLNEGKQAVDSRRRFIESKLGSVWSRIYQSGKQIGFLAIPRVKALVVCGGDGALDVYSDSRHLDVDFFQTPKVEGNKAEIALEQFIESSLPNFWSRIYREGKRIALFTVKPLTILDAFSNRLAIAFCRSCDAESNEEQRGAA